MRNWLSRQAHNLKNVGSSPTSALKEVCLVQKKTIAAGGTSVNRQGNISGLFPPEKNLKYRR